MVVSARDTDPAPDLQTNSKLSNDTMYTTM